MNLSEERVGTIHGTPQNPGAGGWPTLRYFNTETGYGGSKYVQKTQKRICEEMKDPVMVKAWVSEFGMGPSCDVQDLKDCEEREVKYIEKASEKPAADRAKQLTRLNTMKGKKMSPGAAQWISKRLLILKQLVDRDATTGEL